MSTAPSGWQDPKVNWQASDVVTPNDLNTLGQAVNAIETGSRTLDPAQAPTGNQGTIRQFLDWFANRVKAVTGTTNWWDAPAATIATIWSKFNGSSGHKHTGGANDAPPIPLNGIDSAAKTSPGGTEASRLAVTDGSGRVGRAITADKLTGIDAANYARKDQANTWTLRQTFAAGVQDGDNNADVSLVYSVQHQVHTRSTVLTYENGRLTKVEEKDGSTVVKTTTLNYDGNGRLSSVVETAGGITRTSTLNYDANGNLTSVTRA